MSFKPTALLLFTHVPFDKSKRTYQYLAKAEVGKQRYDKYLGSGKIWTKYLKKTPGMTSRIELFVAQSKPEFDRLAKAINLTLQITDDFKANRARGFLNMRTETGDGHSSASAKALLNRPIVKAKRRAAMKAVHAAGTYKTEEYRSKLSAGIRRANSRPEVKARRSASATAAHARGETKAKHSTAVRAAICRPVEQFDLATGAVLATYPSELEAAAALAGGDFSSISACCRGRRKSHLGFGWRFADPSAPTRRIKVSPNSLGGNNHRARSVKQIDPHTGETLAIFPTVEEAARSVARPATGISRGCRGGAITVGGFAWRYVDDETSPPLRPPRRTSERAVVQIDPQSGAILATFQSQQEANAATGVHFAGISRCCTGSARTAGGFAWRYADQTN